MTIEKKVMLLGMDEGEHSFYALETALDTFFVPHGKNTPFKLVIIVAKPAAKSIMHFGPGPASIGEVIPATESYLKKSAIATIETAKELCANKSVEDVEAEIVEGDARVVLCDAAEKYKASVLVVGSHGHNAFTRAVLGSVSDYCAHNANCSVIIMKKPKAHQSSHG